VRLFFIVEITFEKKSSCALNISERSSFFLKPDLQLSGSAANSPSKLIDPTHQLMVSRTV